MLYGLAGRPDRNKKIRGGRGFRPELIVTACKILEISDEEIAPYFLPEDLTKLNYLGSHLEN